MPTTGARRVRTLRVLLVEDEFLIRWSMAQTLGAAGHVVLEADTAAAARALMSETREPLDAIVLDYRLPDSADLALLAECCGRWPGTPVLLMSAFATQEVAAEALRMGAYRVLHKPMELEELRRTVEEACARSRT